MNEEWLETAEEIVRDVHLLEKADAVKLVALSLETAHIKGEKAGFKEGMEMALSSFERVFGEKEKPHV